MRIIITEHTYIFFYDRTMFEQNSFSFNEAALAHARKEAEERGSGRNVLVARWLEEAPPTKRAIKNLRVFVNGVETHDYRMLGNAIAMPTTYKKGWFWRLVAKFPKLRGYAILRGELIVVFYDLEGHLHEYRTSCN